MNVVDASRSPSLVSAVEERFGVFFLSRKPRRASLRRIAHQFHSHPYRRGRLRCREWVFVFGYAAP